MNYIKQFNAAMNRFDSIPEFKANHITLYMALFLEWNNHNFVNPIFAFRKQLMERAKIKSKTTYYKVIKDLDNYGFVKYNPSPDQELASQIHLTIFGTGSDQKMVTLTNNLKELNTIRRSKFYDKKNKAKNSTKSSSPLNNNTSASMNEAASKIHSPKQDEGTPKSLSEVQSFFQEQNQPKCEAERFFNYYENNGWKVGGKTPMKKWKAAARNWILNIDKFSRKKQDEATLKPPGQKPSSTFGIPL